MKAVVVKLPVGKLAICVCAGLVFFSVCAAVCLHSDAQKRLVPIYAVDTDERAVAITFDCAWGDSDLQEIAQILAENQAPATFFVTGEFAETYGAAVNALRQSGHEIGNHSDAHPHVNRLSAAEVTADATRCSEKIAAVTGAPPRLYRTPYGEYNNTVLSALAKLRLPVIQWDCDSRDWQPDATADSIVQNVLKHIKSGSILLFHVDAKPKATAAALKTLLPTLRAAGYRFRCVSDLLHPAPYTIDPFGIQHKP